jgi:hypothetical protein
LEPFTLIIRSLPASSVKRIPAIFATLSSRPVVRFVQRASLLVLVGFVAALTLAGCDTPPYRKFPEYNFAGRPTPPSLLTNRVVVGLTTGTTGELQILDALRDQRFNVPNTVTQFFISGYSGNNPITIANFPDELRGYVYSNASPYTISIANWGTEKVIGTAVTLNSASSGFSLSSDFIRIYSAQEETGQVYISDASTGGTYALNIPNAYRVFDNPGDTVALVATHDTNSLYRIVKLNANSPQPPGATDCEPQLLPVYCAVPVPGTFDRPQSVTYSLDGTTAYVLNCGVECGGGSNGGASVSFLPLGALQVNNIPTSTPYPPVVTSTVPIPGGATIGVSDGVNLYLAGQQLLSNGLFTGTFTVLPLNTLVPSTPISISDGSHSKMLLADDDTIWVGSQSCANGERQYLFSQGNTTQAANYNCLTAIQLSSTAAPVATVVPAVNQAGSGVTAVTVPYPNQNDDNFYYGSLTGLCWVQGLHKMYTAYGGGVHAFHTNQGFAEINNANITVQGTALDVAYVDATTDTAD